MSEKRFPDVPGGYPFPSLEQEVLQEWQSGGGTAGQEQS